jgi:hypothetical protein
MDDDTVGPSFQQQVRRTFSIGKHNDQNGDAHENTPLLGGANGGHGASHGHTETFEFFFNSHYTPGADSPNQFVKVPANIWHIAKATLLSSKSGRMALSRGEEGRVANCRQTMSTFCSSLCPSASLQVPRDGIRSLYSFSTSSPSCPWPPYSPLRPKRSPRSSAKRWAGCSMPHLAMQSS